MVGEIRSSRYNGHTEAITRASGSSTSQSQIFVFGGSGREGYIDEPKVEMGISQGIIAPISRPP
jgi:hypothetical protein